MLTLTFLDTNPWLTPPLGSTPGLNLVVGYVYGSLLSLFVDGSRVCFEGFSLVLRFSSFLNPYFRGSGCAHLKLNWEGFYSCKQNCCLLNI